MNYSVPLADLRYTKEAVRQGRGSADGSPRTDGNTGMNLSCRECISGANTLRDARIAGRLHLPSAGRRTIQAHAHG